MRALLRNKVPFYYALYEGEKELIDEYGNATGQYAILFGKPQKGFANISTAQGTTETLAFGDNVSYDKALIFDFSCPPLLNISESSVLWIDKLPDIKEDGTTDTPYDYTVAKVAKSLNSVSIAVRKVDVS